MTQPLLRATGLAKRYTAAGELLVFEKLDIELHAGRRIALAGESGTGKSTLLHLLGLLDAPSAGTIEILGRDTAGLDESALAGLRNRSIGFVWQMSTLLREFTAEENVMMPLLIGGAAHAAASQAALERLEEVGLAGRARHLAGELSGGEQQRVVLARALAARPSVLLADEPTGNLDERTGAQIMELIERVHEKHNLATLYVTHNAAFAARADETWTLRGGRLVK